MRPWRVPPHSSRSTFRSGDCETYPFRRDTSTFHKLSAINRSIATRSTALSPAKSATARTSFIATSMLPRRHGVPRSQQSGQVAAALELGFGRLGELEVASLDRAVGLVGRDDHAGREGLRLQQLQPGRTCAVAEQALALAEHHREDQHAQFVDQALSPQCLEQVARALDKKVRAVLALQFLQRCDTVVTQQLAVVP